MGLAASQARFLTLTARKSNIEYQGQQINQQRTVLANKSADVVNKMLDLTPPVPPTSTSNAYYKVAQNLTNKSDGTVGGQAVNGQSDKITNWKLVDAASGANFHNTPTAATTAFCYEITYTYMQAGQTMTNQMYTQAATGIPAGNISAAQQTLSTSGAFKVDDETGDIVKGMIIDNATSFTGGTGTSTYASSELAYGTSFNDAAYNDAMNQYDFNKYTYEKAVSDINSETTGIQSKDKALELKLKQLDSEHTAVSTELEAVKNVITKNIEGTFKTFA